MLKRYYIHTLDGRMAQFIEGQQIYFCNRRIKLQEILVKDLRQIRKDEKAHYAYRKAKNWEYDMGLDYKIIYV